MKNHFFIKKVAFFFKSGLQTIPMSLFLWLFTKFHLFGHECVQ